MDLALIGRRLMKSRANETFKARGFWRALVYLLTLNFLSENLGSFSPELSNFFAHCGLLVLLISYCPIALSALSLRKWLEILVLFAASLLILKYEGSYRTLGLIPFVFALDELNRKSGRKEPILALLLMTTIFYSVFSLLYSGSSVVWIFTQDVSIHLSSLASAFLPHELHYGVTYTGLKICLSFSLLCLAAFAYSKRKSLRALLAVLLSYLMLDLIYMILHSYVVSKGAALFPTLNPSSFHLQFVLFMLLLPPTYLYLTRWTAGEYRIFNRSGVISYLVLLTLLPVFLPHVFPIRISDSDDSGRIFFHSEGQVDWDLPAFGRYGGNQGGMFGLLIQHLRANGNEVGVGAITPDSLKEANTLVIINANRNFTGTEKQLIWDFVKLGGSLLVLGDHTGTNAIREPFNDLLAPVNIRFNFDSALPLVPKWNHGFELRPHDIIQHLQDQNELQIWIGASLSISNPARPVIMGKHAFSDSGNLKAAKNGYLGDMRYAPGENLGDLILVAAGEYGKGRVLVFGDTSSFQNSALFLSSPFVDDVFQWLNDTERDLWPHVPLFPTTLILLLLAFLVPERTGRKPLLISLAVLVTMTGGNAIYNEYSESRSTSERRESLAFIDASHLERVSMDAWGEPTGFGGLAYNLMRNGYYPVVLKEFDEQRIMRGDLIAMIAPSKAFSEQETNIVEKFVRQGGTLILTAGWEEKAGSEPLLRRFGLDVDNVPLGRIGGTDNSAGLSFYEAWPVTGTGKDEEVLCSAWDYPVAILRHYGQGRIILIGDSSFLLNRNLESLHHYSLSNIEFFKSVVPNKIQADTEAP